jgi:hypothetical protein
MPWTKEKTREYNKEYQLKNKEKIKEQKRVYYKNNKHLWDARANVWRSNNKEYYNSHQKKLRHLVREYCRYLHGNVCSVCGSINNLDFHHIEPKNKKFKICNRSYITDELMKELEKCILVCRSCHMLIHREKVDAEAEKANRSSYKSQQL